MKKNLRGKIREFVQSEEGKVGIKSPLTLGVAAGSLLLAHLRLRHGGAWLTRIACLSLTNAVKGLACKTEAISLITGVRWFLP